MRAAQTGGSGELGPTEMEQQAVRQQQALAQQATTSGAQAAQQAQGAQTSPAPPPAPSGPLGVSQPYPAQASNRKSSAETAPPPEAPGERTPQSEGEESA